MPTQLFQKGQIPWNKGVSVSPEMRKRISDTLKKKGIKPIKHFSAQDENHPQWKGNKVSYSGLHYWIYRKLGKPTSCAHCNKPKNRFNWANKSGEYLRDLDDWINLCYSCHKIYDLRRS